MTSKPEKKYTPPNKPLLIYYYGAGKGKTTAALGVAIRAWGMGKRVLILQAIKGNWPTGEYDAIKKIKSNRLNIRRLGCGFVGIMGDKLPRNKHRASAAKAVDKAIVVIDSGQWDLIILDEFADLSDLKLIPSKVLINLLKRPRLCDIIVTGHKPKSGIIKLADIVTEMVKNKHHFDKGVLAKRGIDY